MVQEEPQGLLATRSLYTTQPPSRRAPVPPVSVPHPLEAKGVFAHHGVLQGEVGDCFSMGCGVWGPGLGAARAVGALDPRPEEGAPQWRGGLWAECLHLQLQLSLQLGLLLGLLVALLQVLHQHGNHHVDQHKLGCQHEGHEVDGRDDGVVAGGLLVAVPEGVLGRRVREVRL